MLLDTCGVPSVAQRSTFSVFLPLKHPMIGNVVHGSIPSTLAGGRYRLCWCSVEAPSCVTAQSYLLDMGTLTAVGPVPLKQDRTCVSGRVCDVGSFLGQDLSSSDAVAVLDTCGIPGLPRRMPDFTLVSIGTSGRSLKLGTGVDVVFGGQYRLCWCHTGFDCRTAEQFRVEFEP
jgi:hypothetical protein